MSESSARLFLSQAAFGPTDASVTQLMQSGAASWINTQFTIAPTGYPGYSYNNPSSSVGCPTGASTTCFRDNYSIFPVQAQFFRNALYGNDQLRQRVAFALSEILVTSGQQIVQPYAMASYQSTLLNDAFGNFRTLLNDVTLSPAMGNFLNMVNNSKANPARGTEPNENCGREILQLFSIGLWQLNQDGTQKLDSTGKPIPTYTQATVDGFARSFTGWTYAPLNGSASSYPNPTNFNGQMVAFASAHDTGSKLLLNGVTQAAGQTPQADLQAALDNIFQHPNVGPFIGRQLIQQLVTSNPSPAYVSRVAAAFNNNGQGVRGDMRAVVSAVLLDPEASTSTSPNSFGKLREPALLIAHFMRALGGSSDGVMLRGQSAVMGESIFSPNSVFNFFPPDNGLPDDPALQGPPFGVFNATSAFATANFFNYALSVKGIAPDPTVPGSTGTKIDLSHWVGLATNPASLVAEINRVLLAGQMSQTLSTTLLNSIQTIPATNPTGRATTALFLTALSPEYLVEH